MLPMEPEKKTPYWARPSTTHTMMSVFRRPYRSEIQPITPRPGHWGQKEAVGERDDRVVGQIHVVGEQQYEGPRPVGKPAVDETGLAALAFGIPLPPHVDARRVDETGRASAEEPEAQVREDD